VRNAAGVHITEPLERLIETRKTIMKTHFPSSTRRDGLAARPGNRPLA
jgi:hypothetical protein